MLIEKNWKDLFVIFLVQWIVPIHLIEDKQFILAFQQKKIENDKNFMKFHHNQYLSEFILLKKIFENMIALGLDANEFEFLKTLTYTRTGNFRIGFIMLTLKRHRIYCYHLKKANNYLRILKSFWFKINFLKLVRVAFNQISFAKEFSIKNNKKRYYCRRE